MVNVLKHVQKTLKFNKSDEKKKISFANKSMSYKENRTMVFDREVEKGLYTVTAHLQINAMTKRLAW